MALFGLFCLACLPGSWRIDPGLSWRLERWLMVPYLNLLLWFPAWRRNRPAAELLSPTEIRRVIPPRAVDKPPGTE